MDATPYSCSGLRGTPANCGSRDLGRGRKVSTVAAITIIAVNPLDGGGEGFHGRLNKAASGSFTPFPPPSQSRSRHLEIRLFFSGAAAEGLAKGFARHCAAKRLSYSTARLNGFEGSYLAET